MPENKCEKCDICNNRGRNHGICVYCHNGFMFSPMEAEEGKPRQPETEKRVFEGIVGDDSYAGICFGDNKKLSLNIVPETEDEERAWRKLLNMRVRITVEVLK